MKPTRLVLLLIITLLLSACGGRVPEVGGGSCASSDLPFPRPEPDYNTKRVRDLSPFADALAGLTADRRAELDKLLADATVLDMQQAMAGGALTSAELVTYYIDRIQRYDIDKLNSVMELNSQALEIARQLDAERAAGTVRGNMHGIPVLLGGRLHGRAQPDRRGPRPGPGSAGAQGARSGGNHEAD